MSPISLLRRSRICFLALTRPLSFQICYYSSTSSFELEADLSHPIYVIWGSNTGVGKTLVSAGLASSVLATPNSKFSYLKPVQTGFPQDSDSRFVYRKVSEIFSHRKYGFALVASNHALKASVPAAEVIASASVDNEEGNVVSGFRDLCCYEERRVLCSGSNVEASELVCKTIYGWKEAISPHLAAEMEGAVVDDSLLRESLQRCLGVCSGQGSLGRKQRLWSVVETAGGVASPGPMGTLQCDLYRPFRFPAILVGDGRLGGISGTISAYETLKLRGYDVVAIILEDQGLANDIPLLSYLRNRVEVLVLPRVPQDLSDNLLEWFDKSQKIFSSLQEIMLAAYSERIKQLHDMPKKAGNVFWWPFTQHKLVPKEIVTVIDSRCGENFAIHKVRNSQDTGVIAQQFDACASWWTQGPDATLQIELARDMGYATARFGHVMFPENVYEPALRCAELLLEGVGRGWASRTFFSDNGSTSIEIALKMAFRKFSADHGIYMDSVGGKSEKRCPEFKVLALKGSYHGDTLGAMEAQAPSSYTGFLQQPWYSGRGFFLDPPTASISNGVWNITIPEVLQLGPQKLEAATFSSCKELFYEERACSDLAGCYLWYISEKLSQFSKSEESALIAALIIEPVIQGAGGMDLIDPLFQRILVSECRSLKVPVIFDEVFTGFWRLGAESAAEILGCVPDIACYAKLMTGGIVPFAATLATNAVFDAFKGDSKLMALLHGHSYSGHAMGCTAAAKAIEWFRNPSTNFNLTPEGRRLIELWDNKLVLEISSHSSVQRVVALGTLCAIELKAGDDAGYSSLCASSLVQNLRKDGVYMRPLGNVIYLMCGPCTSTESCNHALRKVYQRIRDDFSQESCNKSDSRRSHE
ncbi:bifunctional dethiobiotin synthetase/7,8-diamino-pelargonic acid aminotransferase, mitochondrial [Aristolochia californica]|uniref:bifunctional dethiobiotin synthetase/7,8-diamino-pelargonic acid aminotransferase, mitochondrial n=1 Tax=Aristolochia californica TaxID=171875 RepID=UPI0035DD5B92